MILPLILIFIPSPPSQHPFSFRFHQFLNFSPPADRAGLHWILLDSVNPDLVFLWDLTAKKDALGCTSPVLPVLSYSAPGSPSWTQYR